MHMFLISVGHLEQRQINSDFLVWQEIDAPCYSKVSSITHCIALYFNELCVGQGL